MGNGSITEEEIRLRPVAVGARAHGIYYDACTLSPRCTKIGLMFTTPQGEK